MERVKALHVVYADWCPHCVPATVGPMQSAAKTLGVPCVLHDIDTEDERVADEIVRNYGDWSPDYLIPQVFLEFETGDFKHVLTGIPAGVALTRRVVEDFLGSDLFKNLRPVRPVV